MVMCCSIEQAVNIDFHNAMKCILFGGIGRILLFDTGYPDAC